MAGLEREKCRDCAWRTCDYWMHINQCLKHAIRFEPEHYDLDSCNVSGHGCEFSETCGYEKERSPIEKPTAEEMAAYKSGVRKERIMSTLNRISKDLAQLKELLSEEFGRPQKGGDGS